MNPRPWGTGNTTLQGTTEPLFQKAINPQGPGAIGDLSNTEKQTP